MTASPSPRPRRPARLVALLAALLFSVPASAPAAAKPPAGHLDDGILKFTSEDVRLIFLVRRAPDLDIHLPIDQRGLFNDRPVISEAEQVLLGAMSKGTFLQRAPGLLKKHRDQVEKALGPKLPDAKALLEKPQNKAELYLELLSEAIKELRPSTDKPRVTIGRLQQTLYDEDDRRRTATQRHKPPPPDHDADWLKDFYEKTNKSLMDVLTPQEQKELLHSWPTLFPDGKVAVPPVIGEEKASARERGKH